MLFETRQRNPTFTSPSLRDIFRDRQPLYNATSSPHFLFVRTCAIHPRILNIILDDEDDKLEHLALGIRTKRWWVLYFAAGSLWNFHIDAEGYPIVSERAVHRARGEKYAPAAVVRSRSRWKSDRVHDSVVVVEGSNFLESAGGRAVGVVVVISSARFLDVEHVDD